MALARVNRSRRVALVVVALLAGLQVLAIAVFDVAAGELPFNDDWQFAWPAARLAAGHGLVLYPEQAVPAIPQALAGAIAWLIHPGMVALRLQSLLFAVAAAGLVALISRAIGAGPFWSAVAAVALLTFPVFAAVTTSFMSEPLYLGLLLAGAWLSIRFLENGAGPTSALLVPIIILATLQRQQGAGLAPALTLGLLAARGPGAVRDHYQILGGVWLATLVGLVGPSVLHLSTPEMAFRGTTVLRPQVALGAALVAYTPAMVGLVALPFLAVTVAGTLTGGRARSTGVVAMIAAGFCAVTLFATHGFPGNYVTTAGLGPITVPGTKPQLLGAVLPPLELASLICFVCLTCTLYRRRTGLETGAAGIFLVVLAIAEAAPIVTVSIWDRYYIAVLAPLLPLIARVAELVPWKTLSAVGAVGGLAALSALYVVTEQDYLAWQGARDVMARSVVRQAPGSSFYPGYEPYGVLVVIPAVEAGRRLHSPDALLPLSGAPRDPDLVLVISARDDPRPGISYDSLAPGRVVLECRRPSSCPRAFAPEPLPR